MTTEQLSPFGLVINAETPGASLTDIEPSVLRNKLEEHRVVVLREFAPLVANAFPAYCQKFGEILEWEFGSVNQLRVKEDAQNYLYTNHAVPYHNHPQLDWLYFQYYDARRYCSSNRVNYR